jgi:hypothetical protein
MKQGIELTEDQKNFIDQNYENITDLIEMTRAVFMDEGLDGRTKEGRAVRSYLVKKGVDFSTTKAKPAKNISLTDEQKEFIKQYSSDGINAFQIAKIIFPEGGITPLSKETIVVTDYIRDDLPASLSVEDTARGVEYCPPASRLATMKKINSVARSNLKEGKMTRTDELCIDSTMNVLNSPRFLHQMNSYTDINDRNLFEAEMVRSTWDKHDLTTDEINLYINVCMDYINLKQIEKQKLKLNDMFDTAEEETDLTIRLTEILKTKSEEYNQCVGRIDRVITKLQGDRAKRLNSKHEQTASVLSLVKLFQEEEERVIMLKMAEMQHTLIEEEADKVESMPSWKARVLGVSRKDAI